MQSKDYFIVSGISTDIIVECVNVITRSPSTDRARGLVDDTSAAKIEENRAPVLESSSNEILESQMHSPVEECYHPSTGDGVDLQDIADKAATRKQLRAKRKEDILKHLALKPIIKPSERNTAYNHTEECVTLSLPSLAMQIVELEDGLLNSQSAFNQQLQDAAASKISIRDNIVIHHARIKEISRLLQDDEPSTGVNVSFLPGEYTTCNLDHIEMNNDSCLRNLYLRGTIHDKDFLLHGDVDLSPAAGQAKEEAKHCLREERARLVQAIQVATNEFDETLCNLKRNQLGMTLKLELGRMKLDLQLKQMEVLLEFGSKVEKLYGTALNTCICESAMEQAVQIKNEKLKALACLMPMSLSDIELSEASDDSPPMLVSKRIMQELSCKFIELESRLDCKKSQASKLHRQKKSIVSYITKMQKEYIRHKSDLEKLQMQKIGKTVDSSVLDISPVANKDQCNEVNKIRGELESFHQHDVDHAKRKQSELKAQLLTVTNENTKLLLEIASLRKQHMKISEDIKRATSSNSKTKTDKNDMAEHERFRSLSSSQKAEIDQLRHEIQSLKTKCGHVALNPRFNL